MPAGASLASRPSSLPAVARAMARDSVRAGGRDGALARAGLETCEAGGKSSISDLSLVIGTSGKRELGDKTQHRHFLLPDEIPSRVDGYAGKIGIVFGPEGKGLLNDELRECEILVT